MTPPQPEAEQIRGPSEAYGFHAGSSQIHVPGRCRAPSPTLVSHLLSNASSRVAQTTAWDEHRQPRRFVSGFARSLVRDEGRSSTRGLLVGQLALFHRAIGRALMTISAALDSAGRRRSPATMPGHHAGRAPRNKGLRYPADPPTVQEIVAVMREAGSDRHGARLRALIVVLWRGGLRIQEALAPRERDLDPQRGSLVVRTGKGGRRREIGLDAWGWEQLRPWLAARVELPVGPLFCVIDGPTRGTSGQPTPAGTNRLIARRAGSSDTVETLARSPHSRTRHACSPSDASASPPPPFACGVDDRRS
jgi:integrase